MKKRILVIAGIIAAAILLIVICMVIMIRRIPKDAITFNDFQKYTEESGYEFIDNRERIPVDEIGKSCAAFIREGVGVEFTECVSDQIAKQLYHNYEAYAENFKETVSRETSVNFMSYGSYTLETSEVYMHITRIGNTIMHVRVTPEEKETVVKIMKDLGYMN